MGSAMRVFRRAGRTRPEHAAPWARSVRWPAVAALVAPVVLVAAMSPPHARVGPGPEIVRPARDASASTQSIAAYFAPGIEASSATVLMPSAVSADTTAGQSGSGQSTPAAAPVLALATDGIPI